MQVILCPSAPLTEGSLLFGLIDRRGQVSYSQAAVPVSKELLLHLPLAETAEQEFRFASPCAATRCIHWAEGCSLSSKLSQFQAFPQDDSVQDHCAIRSQCRWYLQDGPQMCSNCQIHSRVAAPIH